MKIKYYFSIAMAALVMTNCSQEEELQDIQQSGDIHTLTATIEGSSRSAVTDGGVFSWTSDDEISVWDGDSYETYKYSGTDNKFNGSANQISGYAIYPNGSHPNYSGSGLPQVNLSSTYTYGSTNAIMLAKVQGSSDNLSFNHLGGLMRFTIKDIPSDATSFTFTANSGITGDFQVETQNDGTNVIKAKSGNSNKSVTINFTSGQTERTFYVPLPVGTYTGFTITVDNCSYTSQATNTINRRTLLLMPTFTCDGTQLTKGGNAFTLENTVQDMNVSGDETLVIETPNSNDANAQLNLNYAPTEENATLNISDGQTGDSQDSKAKVVVDVKNNNTVAELNIDAPTLTVELASGTYETITAKTARQTLIIKSGVKVNKLIVKGGEVIIEKGADVEERTDITLRVLTFEDGTEKFETYTITGYDSNSDLYYDHSVTKWSDLIDTPEYSGPLAYGDMGFYGEGRGCDYNWYDKNNTFLASEFPVNYNSKVYWGGGHVISNYASEDYTTYGTYNNQQTVYGEGQEYGVTKTGGRNGSSNFAMHFGYKDGSPYNGTENLPYIYFKDNTPRIIDHMYVNNSAYAISCYMDGNGLTAKIGDEDWVKAIATGYDIDGNVTDTAEFYLCNGPDNIVTEWTKWDLTSLGMVYKVEFNITGSSDNGYGFSQPAYFAYDDVAVQFTE